MAQLQTLMPILQEFRQELPKFYGKRLVKLILFGSQARGNANEDSNPIENGLHQTVRPSVRVCVR